MHYRERVVWCMMDVADYIKRQLSSKRFQHVAGVADTAERLALRFGVDVGKAVQAAWLHDAFREMSEMELRELAHATGIDVPAGESTTWHGPICAARLRIQFGVDDGQIEEAVRWHTVGHPEMGSVAQVVYVADAIEPSRDYVGIDVLRDAANQDLAWAVALVTDASIHFLLQRHAPSTDCRDHGATAKCHVGTGAAASYCHIRHVIRLLIIQSRGSIYAG